MILLISSKSMYEHTGVILSLSINYI